MSRDVLYKREDLDSWIERNLKSSSEIPTRCFKSSGMFSNREAAEYLGFAETTLKISRVNGYLNGSKAPIHYKLGRSVLYKKKDLDEWVEKNLKPIRPKSKSGEKHYNRRPENCHQKGTDFEDDCGEEVVCDFCGKLSNDAWKVIKGINSAICDECVDLCSDILAEHKALESIR